METASPRVFAYLDAIDSASSQPFVQGWLLTPEGPADSLKAFGPEGALGMVERVVRQDLAEAFPAIPNAAAGGFEVRLGRPVASAEIDAVHELVAMRHGRVIGKIAFVWPEDPLSEVPPADLVERVAGTGDPLRFRTGGLWNSAEVVAAALRSRPRESIGSVLEWGCGVGRMTLPLLRLLGSAELTAVDIDRRSLEWLAPRAQRVRLLQCGALPPLPFADCTFDVVLAVSVVPDVPIAAHRAWSPELARVLRPGGLFILTTLCEHAAAISGVPVIGQALSATGWFDGLEDARVHARTPSARIHATFLSCRHAIEIWGHGLTLLEHCEAKLNFHHDLWVFAKPAGA